MKTGLLEDLRFQGYSPRSLLDVGAHIGTFTVEFLQVFPDCVPTLVEPNPHCQEDLARLPFERHAFAASAQAGVAEMFLTREWLQSTGSSLYRENTAFFRDEVVMKAEVPTVRLDDVFAGRRFDFVKIDTQGAELDVLAGGRKVIAQADHILVEVSFVDFNAGGAKAEAVFAELAAMGFRCA
jgi:FkbM family methyltransferase